MFSAYDYRDKLLDAISAGGLDDTVSELAVNAIPMYTGDIVDEWLKVPSGIGEELYSDMSVDHLMSCDLYVYYSNLLREYSDELIEEYELEEENE